MDHLPPFPGFRAEAFDFLRGLAANNRRDWFRSRKQTFEDEIQWPLRCLVVDVADRASALGLPLRADPKKSLFRIYRDTRFSSNKDPYKTACGAVLSRSGTHRDPGVVYVHLEPDRCFLASGFWKPDSDILRRWRSAMASDPDAFLSLVHDLAACGLELDRHDDMLKRVPSGYGDYSDPEIALYLRYRSFTVSRAVDERRMGSPDFAEDMLAFSRETIPLLDWGWRL